MNSVTQSTTPAKKATRNRAFIRSYDYDGGVGTVKDAVSGKEVIKFDIDAFPPAVLRKLALAKAMDLTAAAGVEATREGEDGVAAMSEAVSDLTTDAVEFRDGVGIAMGGTLKRVGRALVELGKVYAASPDGKRYTWDKAKGDESGYTYVGAEGIQGAFLAMKALWDTKEGVEPKHDSGRTQFNRIKGLPEIAAKLQSYGKAKKTVELG